MSFEPIEEMTEEVEKPESWWMTMTSTPIIVALLALGTFLFFATANYGKFYPK